MIPSERVVRTHVETRVDFSQIEGGNQILREFKNPGGEGDIRAEDCPKLGCGGTSESTKQSVQTTVGKEKSLALGLCASIALGAGRFTVVSQHL